MKRLFGTDGIRGIANVTLTGDLAYKIGLATAKLLNTNHFRNIMDSPFKDRKPVVIISTDTRPSKDLISSGLISGLCAGGVNILPIGILPTPAVAYLTKYYPFVSVGIMITASHNPKEYNGIKIIGPDGYKLADELEEQIEYFISNITEETLTSFFSKEYGKVSCEYSEDAKKQYLNFLKSPFVFSTSNDLTIAVDCANGSASTCYNIFKKHGFNVAVFNNNLSGEHINENCGSTHLEFLQDVIKKEPNKFDCGIAFDGDADRCLLIDETGEVVDGDHILAIVSNYLKEQGKLRNNTIVGTVMSNLGLIKFCEEKDIKFLSTKVGDKYVLEEMITNDCCLGGEQSGHIIFKDYATTGDGLLTALMVLNIMYETHTPLSVLKNQMYKYPQVLSQLTASEKEKNAFVANVTLKQAISNMVADNLGDDGRAVVRPSGTENCIRIMIEGKDKTVITQLCNDIRWLIISHLELK